MANYSPSFEAQRDLDTKSLYWNRLYYKERTTQIFENINNNYIDLWYDVPFYGKVNEFGNLVMPKISSLTYGAADNLVTLQFVRQAYEELRFYLQRGHVAGRTNLQDLFGNFEIGRSFEDSVDKYLSYAFSILEAFNKEIVDSGTFIVSPKRYMRAFTKYLKKNKIIFSFYSFFASPAISPRASGLVLEIVLQDADNDIDKNKYFANPGFHKYISAAANFGFRVDKNAPWTLIADLNSKPMREGHTIIRRGESNTVDGYLQQHYIPDLDFLFENYYDKVIDVTYFLLKATLYQSYREYQDLMQYLVTPGKTIFTPDINFKMASTAAIKRGPPVTTPIAKYTFEEFVSKVPNCLFLRMLESLLKTEFKTKNNRKYHKFRKDFYDSTQDIFEEEVAFSLGDLEAFYNPTKVFDPKTLKPYWTIPKDRRNLLTLAPDDVMIPSEKKMPTVERIVTEYYTGF